MPTPGRHTNKGTSFQRRLESIYKKMDPSLRWGDIILVGGPCSGWSDVILVGTALLGLG